MLEQNQDDGGDAGALAEVGYVLIRNAIDQALIGTVRDTVLQLLTDVPMGRNEFEGLHTQRIYSLFSKTRVLDELAVEPRISHLLRKVLSDYYLSAPAAIAIHPGAEAQPMHRDDAVFPVQRPRQELMVSVMWPLVPFSADNGGTLVVPGSHLWIDREPQPQQAVAIEANPGDALVYRGSLWHGGGANLSDKIRLGVVLNYSVAWLRQVENQSLCVPADVAEAVPERVRSLLGYDLGPSVIGYVDGQHPNKVIGDASSER